MKILPHYPLVLPSKKIHDPRTFCKIFSHERKPSKSPTKEKNGGKKSKRSGEERKQKVKDVRPTNFLEKNYLEILLSVHARTLKAVIWHQEQKLVQCSTCKQRFGQFGFFLARRRPKNGLTHFKKHFWQNVQESMG